MVMCCLIMIGLTFIIWLLAMATPDWIVFYVRNNLYPTGMSLKMSLFCYVTCESTRTCDLIAISWDMADPKSYPSNQPSIPEIQIVSTFAIILCGAVFVLELVNFRIFSLNPSKTVTSAILMLIAIVSETVLIGRIGRMVTRVTDEFKRIHRSELADLERKLRGADITNIDEIISFFVLESRNFLNKIIPRVELDNGDIIYNQFDILKETKHFYQKLYGNIDDSIQNVNLEEEDKYPDIVKLSEEESKSIEGHITLEEAGETLYKMKSNKSPGSDGFTSEFLKMFWKLL
ncbi:uncharacterized protein LOC134250082, partial [Saccostrea cucullata]|uniref:uncharacterized protein LOC134250082 n=1 Tax=Saccostrea cuccullata TaxID=36930 RepID=UPI002ED399F2